jgi:predicted amidohydrolase YtcJ
MCVWCTKSEISDRLTAGYKPSRRQFMAYAASASVVLGTSSTGHAATSADVILRNGTIYPMAAGQTRVEALAIGAGRIMAAGSVADVMTLASANTRMIDLQGRTVFPGFIDPHNHTILGSIFEMLFINVGFAIYKTKADVIGAMKAAVAKLPAGEWGAFAFYDNMLQGGDWTMADLDAVSTNHPIVVCYANGHAAAANRLGFEKANITASTGTLPGGGFFGRTPAGQLNGMIYNPPAILRFVEIAVPKPNATMISKAIATYSAAAASAGLTALHEPGTLKPQWFEHIAQLTNSLPVRLSASLNSDEIDAAKAYTALGPSSKARRFPGTRFSLYGVKFWTDGSNQLATAAQTKPYLNTQTRGSEVYTPGEMQAICQKAKNAGWTILAHCQGDASLDEYLNAMEAVYGANPPSGLNRVEHATMARQDQIDRMKRLGCEPSFMPDFVYLYGNAYRDTLFGPERGNFMIPFGAAAKAGIGFSLHSDNPAAGMPMNPLRLIQTAVTRRCVADGSIIGPELCLTVDQAIRGVTQYAARHLGLGDEIGTLEKGKEADLTILESDPYTTDPEKLSSIKVSQTWVAGEKMFG